MSSSKKDLAFITTNVVVIHTLVGYEMREPKLGKLELQIMETLWTRGQASIREIQEAFPERARPAYTTIQTTVYRLEGKNAGAMVRLSEALEEQDDVQNVYSNFDIDEKELEALAQ